jgi:hypothetical protein
MGYFLPKGTKIKNLLLTGRTNSIQVTDLEIRIKVKQAATEARWDDGIWTDTHMTNQSLFSGNFRTPNMSTDMNDFRRRKIDLGDHVLAEDSFLSLYMKPVGTLSTTKYFMATWSYEIEGAVT